MPIKLADLAKQTKTVTVAFEGAEEPLTVTYRPRFLTPARQVAFEEAARAGRHTELLTEGIVGLVAEWDLLSDDGQPVALTAEGLADVPLEVLSVVVEAIGRDVAPSPLPGNGSAATSSLAGT